MPRPDLDDPVLRAYLAVYKTFLGKLNTLNLKLFAWKDHNINYYIIACNYKYNFCTPESFSMQGQFASAAMMWTHPLEDIWDFEMIQGCLEIFHSLWHCTFRWLQTQKHVEFQPCSLSTCISLHCCCRLTCGSFVSEVAQKEDTVVPLHSVFKCCTIFFYCVGSVDLHSLHSFARSRIHMRG